MFKLSKVGPLLILRGGGGGVMTIYETVFHTNYLQTEACPNLLLTGSISFRGKHEEIHLNRITGDFRFKKESIMCISLVLHTCNL